jgi:hypothetical protein
VRLRVVGLAADGGWRRLETRLRRAKGVRHVRASHLTGNVLVHFDPSVINPERLLAITRGVVGAKGARTRRGSVRRRLLRAAAQAKVVAIDGVRQRREAYDRRGVVRSPRSRVAGAAAVVRSAFNALPTVPVVQRRTRKRLRSRLGSWIVALPSIISLLHAIITASSPIGLVLAGVEAIQLFDKIGAVQVA